MEDNLPEGLTVFALPVHQRRRMRTSNMLERLNRELKRRTRVATLFPNEASLLRLVSAVLVEVSEEWETGKTYLRIVQPGTWVTLLSGDMGNSSRSIKACVTKARK